jgi:hypothetical protein
MKKIVLLISIINWFGHAYSQRKTLTENFLNNVGDSVVVSGKIYGGAFLTNVKTKPTFLNLGDTSPRHRLIIRIEPEDRDKFPTPPEIYYLNKQVQVTGKLQEYKGSPLIRVSEPAMIKTGPPADSTPFQMNNTYTGVGTVKADSNTATKMKEVPVVRPELKSIRPDSVVQSNWIKSVTEKAAEEKRTNLRVVQKEIELRTAPFADAPVIAELHPGMLVSILYTSRKWSYVSVGSVDGFNNVNGFIKHKRFRHLKKVPVK